MKSSVMLRTMMALSVIIFSACQSKREDSSEVAKEANDAAINDRDEKKDADFIVNAVAGNFAEIKLAQLALRKSSSASVKDMATLLEKDHAKVLNELQGYASKRGIVVPDRETSDATKDFDALAKKEGNEFDNSWCSMLKDKHANSISLFETRMDRTEDVELKNWISTTLPALKHHFTMLEDHKTSMK